mgnify:CR=1 FL=1
MVVLSCLGCCIGLWRHAAPQGKYLDVKKNRFDGELGKVPFFYDTDTERFVERATPDMPLPVARIPDAARAAPPRAGSASAGLDTAGGVFAVTPPRRMKGDTPGAPTQDKADADAADDDAPDDADGVDEAAVAGAIVVPMEPVVPPNVSLFNAIINRGQAQPQPPTAAHAVSSKAPNPAAAATSATSATSAPRSAPRAASASRVRAGSLTVGPFATDAPGRRRRGASLPQHARAAAATPDDDPFASPHVPDHLHDMLSGAGSATTSTTDHAGAAVPRAGHATAAASVQNLALDVDAALTGKPRAPVAKASPRSRNAAPPAAATRGRPTNASVAAAQNQPRAPLFQPSTTSSWPEEDIIMG